VIATVLSYLLLVAIFTHWGWPLMILTTVPLGLAGGVIGLALPEWSRPAACLST